MRRVYWWLFIVYQSLKWLPGFNLGDEVRWRGGTWMLIQGVCSPSWDLARGWMADGTWERVNYIHQREFRKVRTVSNYWHSFRSGYSFYMTCWYDIWVREGVLPWMRGCSIWK